MSVSFLLRRVVFLAVVIWVAATITFFIPRLSTRNPVRQRFNQLAQQGGFSPQDLEKIIASYNEKFGLDKPVLEQYVDYVGSLLRGDLGYSLNQYPKTVTSLISDSLPWTIGLLLVTTVISFVIGNFIGALGAWPRSPQWVKGLTAPFIMLQSIPPALLGILLIYYVAFKLQLLPLQKAYTIGVIPNLSLTFILDVMRHQLLPALSLILASIGGWALTMRGMGVTIQGEDYVNFAEHKGLAPRTIFGNYYVRNALLPQVTGLALAFANVISSGILVENLYALPGLGGVLSAAISNNDFPVIYGIVLFIVIAVAVLILVTEIFYPLLDPRVRFGTK